MNTNRFDTGGLGTVTLLRNMSDPLRTLSNRHSLNKNETSLNFGTKANTKQQKQMLGCRHEQ
jgi:hypothetical protein